MKRLTALLLAALLICAALSACAETLTLSLLGDCTIGDQWCYRGYKSSFTYKTTENGLAYPFSLAADLLAADDLTIANCEGALTKRSAGKNAKFMTLGAKPEFAEVFKLGNVDVCNLANNHGKDFGASGQKDTAAALAAFGIDSFYDSVTLVKEVKGVKIGFVGYTYPYSDAKIAKYGKALAALREEGCGFVIASCHWGRETYYKLDSAQKKYGTQLIDMGFDMVYGTGSHTCELIQYYNGKLIFYGTSNFVFGANGAPNDDDTAIVQITYDIAEDGAIAPGLLTVIPYRMHRDRDFRPYPIEDEAGKRQVWEKFFWNGGTAHIASPESNLPESFLTTGIVDFRALNAQEGSAADAE